MNVQTVREGQRGAFLHVGGEMVAIEIALPLIRGEHHHHVGPGGGFRGAEHLQASSFGLGDAGGAWAQANHHIFHAAVGEVAGVGVALAAVADDGDALALDQVNVGVSVVIYAHWKHPMR